ncbi:MAG: hypothetical protein LBQ93_04860 [Treponema sp.]|jgi:hypothetical protein|nr:hypothetical protein [Treponema sp.]
MARLPKPFVINRRTDGGDIGDSISDAIRNIVGRTTNSIRAGMGDNLWDRNGAIEITQGSAAGTDAAHGVLGHSTGLRFNASWAVDVLTAHENRPVSISVLVCISY